MNAKLRSLLKSLGLLGLWLDYKQRPYIALNAQTARLWQSKIEAYQRGKLPQLCPEALRPEFVGKPIIWQFWGQGFDEPLPEVVQHCFDSVDRHCGEYQVIRLSLQTLSQYISLPDYVFKRLESSESYQYAFLADLIRIALLAAYGGVWMDATIYMSGPLPSYATEADFFMYERSLDESPAMQQYFRGTYYPYWGWREDFEVRCLNAFIVAQPRQAISIALYSLLLAYWEQEAEVHDYFFFQVLYHQLRLTGLYPRSRTIVSDCLPHLLGASLGDKASPITPETALARTTIHKLNSKGAELPLTLHFLQNQ